MKRIGMLVVGATILVLATAVITRSVVQRRGAHPWPPPPGVAAEHLATPPPSDPATVSMVRLLADPGAYDGKAIRTVGFARIEFEGDALYLHREDFAHVLSLNSVRLSVPQDRPFKPLSDRYVIVEGIFDAPRDGYPNIRGGAIRDISRFDPLPTREGLAALLGLPAQ